MRSVWLMRFLGLARQPVDNRTGRRAPADDGGHVLEPGSPGPLLIPADEQRRQAQPPPHQQRTDARRPAHLVSADAHQVGAERSEVDGKVPGGLRGVDVDQHAALAALRDHGLHRLQRADLVVAPLNVHQRGVGPDRGHEGGGIDATLAVAAHEAQVVAGRRQPHGGVLDGRGHDVRSGRGGLGGAVHRLWRSTPWRRS